MDGIGVPGEGTMGIGEGFQQASARAYGNKTSRAAGSETPLAAAIDNNSCALTGDR